MKYLGVIAAALLVIGGLNWGLFGLFQVNLVQQIFGASALSSIVYILVGASALYQALALRGIWNRWEVGTQRAQTA